MPSEPPIRAACCEISAPLRVVVPSRIRLPVRSASQTSSAFSKALPVRSVERHPDLGHVAPRHQRNLEAVVEREAARLGHLEVARRARLGRRGRKGAGGRLRRLRVAGGWRAEGFAAAGARAQPQPTGDRMPRSDGARERHGADGGEWTACHQQVLRMWPPASGGLRDDRQDGAVGRPQVLARGLLNQLRRDLAELVLQPVDASPGRRRTARTRRAGWRGRSRRTGSRIRRRARERMLDERAVERRPWSTGVGLQPLDLLVDRLDDLVRRLVGVVEELTASRASGP